METPGGKVEEGEGDEDAAIREVEEEIGIKVGLGEKLGEGDFVEGIQEYHYVWFGVEYRGEEIRLEPGFVEYGWFDVSEWDNLVPKISAGTRKLKELGLIE